MSTANLFANLVMTRTFILSFLTRHSLNCHDSFVSRNYFRNSQLNGVIFQSSLARNRRHSVIK